MRDFVLYVNDRVGTRQAIVDVYETAEVIARTNDVSTWTLTLPTDTDAGRIFATDTFARLEVALRSGAGEPGYWTGGTPAVPAVPGYLTPTVGTVSTPDVAQTGNVRYTADPVDAATYTRVTGTSRIIGINPAGTVYPGQIRTAQMEAIKRAQLVFPGVTGNYASVPDAANLQVTGDIEVVARLAATTWSPAGTCTIVGKDTSGAGQTVRSWLFRHYGAGIINLAVSINGTSQISAAATALPFTNGQMGWVKVTRVAATGVIAFYSAPDAPTEPTTWTARGTATLATGDLTNNTSPVLIGARGTGGTTDMFAGRIARAIVRNGIAGTTVLDVNENDAGTMTDATHFVASTGQTVTVAQTAGNTIVQPQPDAVVWRFDAADYPGTGTVYTDPRGRTWTMSTAGAITTPIPAIPAVPPTWVPPVTGDVAWRSGPVTHLERTVDLDGDMLTVAGVDDTIWLARRNAHPQPATAAPPYSTTAYDVHTADAATVLAQLVNVNAGPSAVSARRVPGLIVPMPTPAGPTVTVSARWQNLLTLCQDTARGAGVVFDVVDLTFRAFVPADGGVVFSAGLETLAAWTLVAQAATANKVVVAGGGVGTARIIRELTDATSVATWGLAETFEDRRDTTDLTELDKAGTETLAGSIPPTTVVFTPLETEGQQFGRDWNLGDVVTVRAGGLTVIDQIREIHVTLDEHGATVIPSVGTPAGDLALFRSLAGLDRRVRQLERV